MNRAILAGRRFLAVTGAESQSFLQGLITTDVDSLPDGVARPGALLSPQGKILFSFMISRRDTGFVLELRAEDADAFLKRLTLYRLRAKVDLAFGPQTATACVWGEDAPSSGPQDIRFEKAGIRLLREPVTHDGGSEGDDAYRALRIASAVAEIGEDYIAGDVWPHDILLDLTEGLSFRKGCYVGQEVVSRMQHRATTRRRLCRIEADQPLVAGSEILAGGKSAGTLGSIAGTQGLSILRLDRIAGAISAGQVITAGDRPVTAILPEWSGLTLPADSSEDP